MRKALLALLTGALTMSVPLAASANSSSKGVAIVVCANNAGAIQVVTADVTAGITAPAALSDCAAALLALSNAGLKVSSVVQTADGWAYTLTRTSSQNSQD